MRCLKVITLLCLFCSLSKISAADNDEFWNEKPPIYSCEVGSSLKKYLPLDSNHPHKLSQKLPNRNTFHILPLENLSRVWNARRHLYNRIGSLPLVTAFDNDLKKFLFTKKLAKQNYPDAETAIRVWELSEKHVIPIFQKGLGPDIVEGFMLKITSLDTSLETYINDVHSLYLQYLSKF